MFGSVLVGIGIGFATVFAFINKIYTPTTPTERVKLALLAYARDKVAFKTGIRSVHTTSELFDMQHDAIAFASDEDAFEFLHEFIILDKLVSMPINVAEEDETTMQTTEAQPL